VKAALKGKTGRTGRQEKKGKRLGCREKATKVVQKGDLVFVVFGWLLVCWLVVLCVDLVVCSLLSVLGLCCGCG